ncbi:MAG: oligosaccharide flippase family protein [Veillonellaceae bacterium]|nr:oligosaccharide flippase family protein [Veillonellaceae bacterium]
MNGNEKQPGIRTRLLSGIKWTAAVAFVVSTSHLATSILAARLLGLEEFGEFSIIRSTAVMMSNVAAMGIGVAATKHVAELRNTNPERLGRILGLCSLITLVTSGLFTLALLLLSDSISTISFHSPQLAEPLRVSALYIFFVTLNEYQNGVLAGFESFAKLARINAVQAVGTLLLIATLAWFWGLTGAAWALGLSGVLNWYLNRREIRRQLVVHNIAASYRNILQEKEVLTNFALPVAFSGIIGAVTVWVCNAFLVRQPEGMAQMAIFTAAGSFRSLVMFVPGLVIRVATPVLCNLVGEKNYSASSRVFRINVLISAVTASCAAGAIILLSSELLTLFGKKFGGGVEVASLVAVVSVVEVMANTLYQPLLAYGRIWWQVRVVLCWSLILTGVSFLTVGDYGALGLAGAYFAAHLVSLTMYLLVGYRIKKSVEPGLVHT